MLALVVALTLDVAAVAVLADVGIPEAFLGPSALLVAALTTVGILWRAHVKSDEDERNRAKEEIAYRDQLRRDALAERDRAIAAADVDQRRLEGRLDRFASSLKEATGVIARSASLIERLVAEGERGSRRPRGRDG